MGIFDGFNKMLNDVMANDSSPPRLDQIDQFQPENPRQKQTESVFIPSMCTGSYKMHTLTT